MNRSSFSLLLLVIAIVSNILICQVGAAVFFQQSHSQSVGSAASIPPYEKQVNDFYDENEFETDEDDDFEELTSLSASSPVSDNRAARNHRQNDLRNYRADDYPELLSPILDAFEKEASYISQDYRSEINDIVHRLQQSSFAAAAQFQSTAPLKKQQLQPGKKRNTIWSQVCRSRSDENTNVPTREHPKLSAQEVNSPMTTSVHGDGQEYNTIHHQSVPLRKPFQDFNSFDEFTSDEEKGDLNESIHNSAVNKRHVQPDMQACSDPFDEVMEEDDDEEEGLDNQSRFVDATSLSMENLTSNTYNQKKSSQLLQQPLQRRPQRIQEDSFDDTGRNIEVPRHSPRFPFFTERKYQHHKHS